MAITRRSIHADPKTSDLAVTGATAIPAVSRVALGACEP